MASGDLPKTDADTLSPSDSPHATALAIAFRIAPFPKRPGAGKTYSDEDARAHARLIGELARLLLRPDAAAASKVKGPGKAKGGGWRS